MARVADSGGALRIVRSGDSARGGLTRELEPDDLGFEPLSFRLRPPRQQFEMVPRTALLAALRVTTAPLVLLSGPAGSGKSTALTQWYETDVRPTLWLSLTADDSDPVVFFRYLALALGDVAPVDRVVFAYLRLPSPPLVERVLPRLIAALAGAPPFLMVLDDGHVMRAEECWRAVELIADQLPPGAQIAVGTRQDPALSLGRLRVAGRLAELGGRDLAMDAAEAAALLRLRGASVRDGALAKILDATEGWPAGIYLASLVAETLPADEWLLHVRGDQREIARYLTDEVLRFLSPDIRMFLMRTSILECLCPSLCGAVTGRDDAAAVLARLASENAFVTPLDDASEWYRYHHLFGELLRAHLEARVPDEIPDLHRAAAIWHAQTGDTRQAVIHWLAAGDVSAATRLAAVTCGDAHRGGDLLSAAQILRLFSTEEILSDQSLTLNAGWILGLVCGDESEQRWGPIACRVPVDDEPCSCLPVSHRAYQLLLRALLGPDGVTEMLRDAEEAARLECRRDSEWYLEAQSVLGLALYLSGRNRRAVAALQIAAGGTWSDRANAAWALGLLSILTGDEGRWDEATEFNRLAVDVELGSDLGGDEEVGYPVFLTPLLSSARILSRRGDPKLTEHLAMVRAYLARMVPQSDNMLLLACVIIGEIHLEQNDLERARTWCARAAKLLKGYPDAGVLGARVIALTRAIEESLSIVPLTTAEHRVLDLMPTNLTAEEIAEDLFVSVTTVRTHMRAIHRKLDAGTRSEAVHRARSLGLLQRES